MLMCWCWAWARDVRVRGEGGKGDTHEGGTTERYSTLSRGNITVHLRSQQTGVGRGKPSGTEGVQNITPWTRKQQTRRGRNPALAPCEQNAAGNAHSREHEEGCEREGRSRGEGSCTGARASPASAAWMACLALALRLSNQVPRHLTTTSTPQPRAAPRAKQNEEHNQEHQLHTGRGGWDLLTGLAPLPQPVSQWLHRLTNDKLLASELVRRNFQIQRRRALTDAARSVVVGAVAGAEPTLVLASV